MTNKPPPELPLADMGPLNPESEPVSDRYKLDELDLFGNNTMHRDALFIDGNRIKLSRRWSDGPRALVIGCNPSDASKEKEDPTSRWWNYWFKYYGFGAYDAANLYPFCSPSPAVCRARVDEIYNGNWHDRDALHYVNLPAVVEMAKAADQVFVCWGAIAWDDVWIEHLVEEIQTGIEPYPNLWCWGKTASGAPKHPLARGKHRIDKHQEPVLWRAPGND